MTALRRTLAALLIVALGLLGSACGNTAQGAKQDVEENVDKADKEAEDDGY